MGRRHLALVACALVLAACGSSEAASPDVASTIGDVGALPDDLPAPSTEPPASTDAPSTTHGSARATATTTTTTEAVLPSGPDAIGELADGNRVIVIGDSIMASISNRYGNQLCEQLVPRGWTVEVDAEVGRFVEFGRRVLAERPPRLWDAAVVMLGNNYAGDPDAFDRELGRLLDELEPLPVLLLTVTPFEREQDEVNWITAVEADRRDDVQLVDWASRTIAGAPGAGELLSGDGLHLTTAGQEALASMIGRAMGRAPAGSEGECLRSSFRDDSAGRMPADTGGRSGGGGSGGSTGSSGGGSGTGGGTQPRPGSTTTTTAAPSSPPAQPSPTQPPPTQAPNPPPTATAPAATAPAGTEPAAAPEPAGTAAPGTAAPDTGGG